LAPHYRVKVQPTSLYRVSKDSVCSSAAQRSSRGLMGILHSCTSSRPSCVMGRVPHRLPWPPPVSGRQTIGSALPSQSSAYFTIQSIKRLCMQLSSSEVQQGPGGHLTQLHFQQTIMCHGASSAPPSVATTCQRALCAASLQSFWICARKPFCL
jgi:hypothetical protein